MDGVYLALYYSDYLADFGFAEGTFVFGTNCSADGKVRGIVGLLQKIETLAELPISTKDLYYSKFWITDNTYLKTCDALGI